MLKILDLDGFKYLGNNFNNYRHIGEYQNFRKNCTYIHLTTTDWENDRNFLDFLQIHIPSLEIVKNLIQKRIEEEPSKKTFHIVIRQDDDLEEFYGKERFYVGYTKPKNIKIYIKENKQFFHDIKESYVHYHSKAITKKGKKGVKSEYKEID
jgi:hypothetical protein